MSLLSQVPTVIVPVQKYLNKAMLYTPKCSPHTPFTKQVALLIGGNMCNGENWIFLIVPIKHAILIIYNLYTILSARIVNIYWIFPPYSLSWTHSLILLAQIWYPRFLIAILVFEIIGFKVLCLSHTLLLTCFPFVQVIQVISAINRIYIISNML